MTGRKLLFLLKLLRINHFLVKVYSKKEMYMKKRRFMNSDDPRYVWTNVRTHRKFSGTTKYGNLVGYMTGGRYYAF